MMQFLDQLSNYYCPKKGLCSMEFDSNEITASVPAMYYTL
jgi:hypothetical protein